MIWCGMRTFDVVYHWQLVYDDKLKNTPVVAVQSLWYTIPGKPFLDKYVRHGLCPLVASRDRNGVCDTQNVLPAVRRWLQHGEAHCNRLQWLRRH